MFAIELESGFTVIEARGSRVPMNDREAEAVVFGVALYTSGVALARFHDRRMVATLLLQANGDFLVTIDAAIGGCTRRYGVALDTTCRTIKVVM